MENRIVIFQIDCKNKHRVLSKMNRLKIAYNSFSRGRYLIIIVFMSNINSIVDTLFHEDGYHRVRLLLDFMAESEIEYFFKTYLEESLFSNIKSLKAI